MKKCIFLMVIFSISQLRAQTIDRQIIQSSNAYYYGEGAAHDANEARNIALKMLTDHIAVHVSSELTHEITETNIDITEKSKLIMQSHSTATLTNVKMEMAPMRDGRMQAFCYILKTEVEKIFEERKKLISEMAHRAEVYLNEGNVADALKLNYYVMLLLGSIPDQTVQYGGVNYTIEIPGRIRNIIRNTHFNFVSDRPISDREREVTLRITSGSRDASLIDFMWWDGTHQQKVKARDGLAVFRLVGGSVDFEELKLNIVYSYFENREEFPVISQLWNAVSRPVFDNQKSVALDRAQAVAVERPPVAGRVAAAIESGNFSITSHYHGELPAAEAITREISQLLNVFNSGNIESVRRVYGHDDVLREKITRYMQHNNPAPAEEDIEVSIAGTLSGWECRSIWMLHRYPSINRQTNEYLVLDFDDDGRLTDINVSVTDALYKKFQESAADGEEWSHQKEIVRFLEKYRTAYLTRDISLIDLMFAEEALIIVGRKIEKKSLPDNRVQYLPIGNQPDFEYLQFKKSEFIQRQRAIFKAQQDISLEFATFDIWAKQGEANVYSVEMRQSYASTTYADEGYLFLLLDFNEEDPLIYVRAWQPNEWNREDMINGGNFRLHR